MMRTAPSLAAALLALLLSSGCARDPAPSLAAAQQQARDALDQLVREQQVAFHAANGEYASDLSLLDLSHLLSPEVRVIIRGADADGWSASATHASLPTTPCILNVGDPPLFAALPNPGSVRSAAVSPDGEVRCEEIES